MAVLNIKARKALQNKELRIDLTEVGLGDIYYKPLSKNVVDGYRKIQKEIQGLLEKRMIAMLNIDSKTFKGDIQNAFFKKFDLDKLIEIQKEVSEERNIVCEFMHSIDGVPDKKTLMNAIEQVVGEDYAEETYLSLCNIVYQEFQEALAEMDNTITPN